MTTNEPVIAGVSILALPGAVLALLVAFGVHVTQAEVGAITGLATILAPAIGFLVRQHVWPASHLVDAPPATATTTAAGAGANPFLPSGAPGA